MSLPSPISHLAPLISSTKNRHRLFFPHSEVVRISSILVYKILLTKTTFRVTPAQQVPWTEAVL